MTTLRVGHDGTTTDADPSRAYVVGRGQVADILVEGASVSRHHLDLIYDGATWSAVDRSSAGTYLNGTTVDRVEVDRPLRLALGSEDGPTIELEPLSALPSSPVIDLPDEHSQVGTIAFDDRALRLDLDDQHLAVMPGTKVVVGRDDSCDLTSTDRLVSGRHCAFEHDGADWVLTDLDSTRGTFVDGRRIKGPTTIEGAFHVGLGDPTAGAQLRVVTAGEHKPPRSRSWMVGALAVVGLLVLGAVALQQVGGDVNSTEQLAAAKQATVLLFEPGGAGTGSGAFVAEDVILTNRHVAELGRELLVASSEQEDAPVTARYIAEVDAVHPYLDLALLRVTRGVDPTSLRIGEGRVAWTESPVTTPAAVLEVGDSQQMQAGNGLHALGFPAITSLFRLAEDDRLVLPAVTVGAGEVVTFQPWPGCDDPLADAMLVEGGTSSACSQDGELPRGNMLTSQLSGSGGSGGPVVVDGRIVAVVYAGIAPQVPDPEEGGPMSTSGSGSSIPTEYFAEWLNEHMPA